MLQPYIVLTMIYQNFMLCKSYMLLIFLQLMNIKDSLKKKRKKKEFLRILQSTQPNLYYTRNKT